MLECEIDDRPIANLTCVSPCIRSALGTSILRQALSETVIVAPRTPDLFDSLHRRYRPGVDPPEHLRQILVRRHPCGLCRPFDMGQPRASVSASIAARVRLGLGMAIRAQIPEVLATAVQELTIDVVDMQRQWFTSPLSADPAAGTPIWRTHFGQRPPQQFRVSTLGAFRPLDQDVSGTQPVRWWPSGVAGGTEMAGVYTELVDAPSQMRMSATRLPKPQRPHHPRHAGRLVHGRLQNFPRVLHARKVTTPLRHSLPPPLSPRRIPLAG